MTLIFDILFIPNLDQNLLSVAQMIKKGYYVVFERDLFSIYDSHDYKVAEAKLENNSFVLNFKYDVFSAEAKEIPNCDKGENEKKTSVQKSDSKGVETKERQCKVAVSDAIFNVKGSKLNVYCNEIKQEFKSTACFILMESGWPFQHESATRSVDNYVWEEIRNFKKCLIMMFAKQGKDLVFLETVMGLAQQRRHCLIECIPLPQKIAKQAPLYFKKAIEEVEHEWSHNAKKLIDTSVKGLRGSVPKDFPYFHVEFGLNSGFVHVIDDEMQFKSTFGLDVIRGMLRLPEEEVYRRRRHESVDAKRQAVANFARDWESFDWTKQLD
ncbi:hypothetical protein GH714_013417 [Hevea brasiliensis]|uniref:Cwf19-like C-terminal domain-containing protein n=1 Tax=Hevea brasiliensis TaxID=3981 RepID=A0A6A6L6D9_HEVBR|nr:hypothetical protein GH714_013417 [Hevea brasiliensis]